jgi:hypothetical protein
VEARKCTLSFGSLKTGAEIKLAKKGNFQVWPELPITIYTHSLVAMAVDDIKILNFICLNESVIKQYSRIESSLDRVRVDYLLVHEPSPLAHDHALLPQSSVQKAQLMIL